MKALILDCDGVLVDSEPAHYRAFRDTLRAEGVPLTEDDYFRRIPAGRDTDFFVGAFRLAGRSLDDGTLARLLEAKRIRYAASLGSVPLLAATVAFAGCALADGRRVGVASGALRSEVLAVLGRAGLADRIRAVTAAEDVREGKPDPEPFVRTLGLLNAAAEGAPVRPGECVVVEDSPAGVRAARAAGMRSVALTTSFPAERLGEADLVLSGLDGIAPRELEARLGAASGEEAR